MSKQKLSAKLTLISALASIALLASCSVSPRRIASTYSPPPPPQLHEALPQRSYLESAHELLQKWRDELKRTPLIYESTAKRGLGLKPSNSADAPAEGGR